jgi:4-hydroxy-2-oxoheptanedioate aldolase
MPVDLPRNAFKRAIAEGRPQIGLWLTLTSPVATEVAAGAGFDWLLIDMEHSANDVADVAAHLRAAEGGTAEPIVRPPWNEPVITKRLLDQGVRSFLFPMVQSVAEAEAAVAATRYPPDGIRGVAMSSRANRYGRVKDYFGRASEEICVLVQTETRRSAAIAHELAAVDGVDGVFIGPSDFSADFGRPGQWTSPDIWNAILDTGRRIKAAGKAVGFLSGVQDKNLELLAEGFTFVAVGNDTALLAERTDTLVRTYAEALARSGAAKRP